MWLAYEGGRLIIFVASLLWMLWFTHGHSPRMRGLALVFCGGVALEAFAVLAHLRDGLCLTAGLPAAGLPAAGLPAVGLPAVGVRWDALGRGILADVGMVLAIGASFMIMVEITRSSQRHKREAEVDHLTGLFNRRVFFTRAEQALKEARMGASRPSVAVFDVDNMKEINDVYGHQCGDEVLRQAAKAIALSIRHDDVPARHGGDEFAVLFLQTGPSLDTLRTRLEEYLEDVRACGQGVCISLSVGIARYPQDGQDVDTLLYTADTRMYLDKATKRHRECLRGEYELLGRT